MTGTLAWPAGALQDTMDEQRGRPPALGARQHMCTPPRPRQEAVLRRSGLCPGREASSEHREGKRHDLGEHRGTPVVGLERKNEVATVNTMILPVNIVVQ